MGHLTIDLHDIYDDSEAIERELNNAIDTAIAKKIQTVDIIPGKGSGQLRLVVMRFLRRKDIRAKYKRFEVPELNHGKIVVHINLKG
jgi:dsDNA-specific endonuclease/ATPase MutS2